MGGHTNIKRSGSAEEVASLGYSVATNGLKIQEGLRNIAANFSIADISTVGPY